MKKNIILFWLFASILIIQTANAQPWIDLLPKDKTIEEITLRDYQHAFNTYWETKNVDDGYIYINGKKQKAGGWKQFKRWEYYMEGVVDPETGAFPEKTGMQVVREHKKSNPEVYNNSNKASNWTCLGPSNSGGGYAGIGRLNCVAFHPSDPNTWWVGAASGGLWVTTNNGASWGYLTDENGVLAVSDIVIPTDYATSNTIYIATGDRAAGDNNSIGVLKSTNNGATWNETGLTFAINQARRVNRLLLDPNDNNTIVAATSLGVFITTDGGETWEGPKINQNFIDMEYKPGDFNTLYGSRGMGIWRSTDRGENWTQVATFNLQRAELAVTPADPEVVYAVVSNNLSGLHGIYKSTNSGESFVQTFSGTTLNLLNWDGNGDPTSTGGQGWYDLCIAASPTNPNLVLVGGVNTWRSSDGGYNWECVNHWWGQNGIQAVHADKHALAYRNDGVLFEGNDGGIYISHNDGNDGSWIDKTNGMQISQMYKLGCAATVANEIITGLQDNGSKLFSGNNWHDVYGGDGMECIIDYTNASIQYATLYYGRIFRTTNHWNSNTEISPKSDGAWVTPYIIDPKSPEILYAGYADLWKTENRGNSWKQISNVSTNNKLRNIAICEADPNVIYMTDISRIWKTIDGGNNWEQLPIPTASVNYLCVKNDDPNTVWFARGNYNAMSAFKSTNGGATWTNISDGLPSIPMYSIVYNKYEGRTEQLYMGTEVGIYFKDGDNNWTAFNTGFPNVKIGEIELYYNAQDPAACRLRAATYGRGLWESPIAIPTTPIKGIIIGNEQVCEYDIVQLRLTDFAGAVQWQQSSNGTTWSDIQKANTALYLGEPLTSSKYFRAKVTLGETVYSDEFFVQVNPVPPTPNITKEENMLISSADEGNQWYNEEGLIPGAIEKSFIPVENGTYYTVVTLNGICPSLPSNSIIINDLSIGGNAVRDGKFKIFPNPIEKKLTIKNDEFKIKRVIIIDVLGKEVINIQKNKVNEVTINVANISSGVYQVKIETDNGTFATKVVKQ